MKTIHTFSALAAATLLITGCCSSCRSPSQMASNVINQQSVTTTYAQQYPAKNPQQVAMYDTSKAPHAAYRVIGVATVSKYNLLGMPRKDNTVNDMMKKLAASIGGDGIMNVNTKGDTVQANVIAFEKILI